MRLTLSLFGLAALGATAPAVEPVSAPVAPAWRWDEPITYDYREEVQPDTAVRLVTADGSDVHVGAFGVWARIICTADEDVGHGGSREIDCLVDDARYEAVPVAEDAGRVAPVLDAYARLFRSARIRMTQRPDGVITDRDVTFPPESLISEKEALLGPWLALDAGGFLRCLDVQLPAANAVTWLQREHLVDTPLEHSLVWGEDGVHGEYTSAPGAGRYAVGGRYDFSLADGRLVRSDVSLQDTAATAYLPSYRSRGQIVLHLGDREPLGHSREVGLVPLTVGPGAQEP